MFWVDNGTGVPTAPTISPVQSPARRYFTEGGQGLQPTIPGGEWFNMVTDELINVLSVAGLPPDKLDHAQLKKALDKLFLGRKDPGAEIKQDNSADKFFDNVGLKSAAKRDVGVSPGQIPDMRYFEVTKLSNDVTFKSPSSLIVKRGIVVLTAGALTSFTFPEAYPNSCMGVWFIATSMSGGTPYLMGAPTKTGFSFGSQGAGSGVTSYAYLAIGD